MRAYAQIAPTFWTRGSGKKLRGNAAAQVLALYMMTCPTSNMIGLFYLPLPTICHETGLTEEQVRSVMPELAEIVQYDFDEELVWIPNSAARQLGEKLSQGDKRRPSVLRDLDAVGHHEFGDSFHELYADSYLLPPRERGMQHRRKGHPASAHAPGSCPVPVLDPVLDSNAREDGPEPVKCPRDLELTADQFASCELDIGMPPEDGIALCRNFTGKWQTDPPRPLGLWRKALWTAVTSSWKDPNQRRKLVRPPGLVAHELTRGAPVPDSPQALADARAASEKRAADREWRYETFLEALREGKGTDRLREIFEHGDDTQLRAEFEKHEARRKGASDAA